jgi:hypothetical protein
VLIRLTTLWAYMVNLMVSFLYDSEDRKWLEEEAKRRGVSLTHLIRELLAYGRVEYHKLRNRGMIK